jgi:phosphatidylserine/phosphatidylglycerophosphate/cardiolipin synthase-like enzyme
MYLSYNQKETNQIIYNEIEKASKYIHITTMFFNDTDLSLNFINLLNHKIREYPDIEIHINIGLNPFLKTNIKKHTMDKKIHVRFIPMKHLIHVYHIRLFSTENIFAVGGIDLVQLNINENYIQFTLFIPTQNNIFISKTINNKSILYDLTENENYYNVSDVYPYRKLEELIHESKEHIFIDNQYLFSNSFINKLIKKKTNSPDIKIEVFSNHDLNNNSMKSRKKYPFKKIEYALFSYLAEFSMKKLRKWNITVKTSENKYTHNKLFIFDKKYIFIGSMNILDKSLSIHGGDIEICVLIKNKKLANEMLDYYDNHIFNLL